MEYKLKKIFKITSGILIGGGLGFAYYYFIGCRTGACPISSNPVISTAYGGLIGLLVTLTGSKEKRVKEKETLSQ